MNKLLKRAPSRGKNPSSAHDFLLSEGFLVRETNMPCTLYSEFRDVTTGGSMTRSIIWSCWGRSQAEINCRRRLEVFGIGIPSMACGFF